PGRNVHGRVEAPRRGEPSAGPRPKRACHRALGSGSPDPGHAATTPTPIAAEGPMTVRVHDDRDTMSFSGDLRGIGLADVFQNLAGNRASGTLCVQSRGSERYVRFEEGAITGVSAGVGKGLPLIEWLIERGLLDTQRVERVLARHRRSRKTRLRILIDARLVNEETAQDAMLECACEQLYTILQAREARYV